MNFSGEKVGSAKTEDDGSGSVNAPLHFYHLANRVYELTDVQCVFQVRSITDFLTLFNHLCRIANTDGQDVLMIDES
jgi:hypothetical protein